MMSDSERPEMTAREAFAIVATLGSENALSEGETRQDPEVLEPMRKDQQKAFAIVEEFLRAHLYGDCSKVRP